MASKYWIKLYHEILDDPKMGRLSDHLYRRTIEMFLLAGDFDEAGALPPVEDIAWRLRLRIEEMETDLADLAAVNIVQSTRRGWLVTNFQERQQAIGDAERMRNYRDRKRKSLYYSDEHDTDSVTKRNTDTDTDIDTDIDIEEDKTIGDETPPPSKREIQNGIRKSLELYFIDQTGLPPPKTKTKAQRKSAGTLWWTPLREIAELTEWDSTRGKALIKMTLKCLSNGSMTVSDPNSIIKTARSEYAKIKHGTSDEVFVENYR